MGQDNRNITSLAGQPGQKIQGRTAGKVRKERMAGTVQSWQDCHDRKERLAETVQSWKDCQDKAPIYGCRDITY
jgi:hypothetical protein